MSYAYYAFLRSREASDRSLLRAEFWMLNQHSREIYQTPMRWWDWVST